MNTTKPSAPYPTPSPTSDSSIPPLSVEDWVTEGEMALLKEHLNEAMYAYDAIEDLGEEIQSEHYYRMGLSLFEYGSEEGHENALLLANKKFKLAHSTDPLSSETLHAWGNALVLLGERYEQHHFFIDALEKYDQAQKLQESSEDLLWDYGVLWYHIGCQSEEAVDLQKGVQAYEQAAVKCPSLPSEFWIDYGLTLLLLSTKVRSSQYIIRSIHCFKRAISIDEANFDSWSNLAEAHDMLHRYTHDEDHFTQANDCYEMAAKLAPQDSEIWASWAFFLCISPCNHRDQEQLRNCIEKCHMAHSLDPDNPRVLGIWCQALASLGQQTERLDLLYEAENKIHSAFDLCEDDPDLWYALGHCLIAFGNYFSDCDYYYQAIEKFQAGLSIDRTCDHIWHVIANTYARVGMLENNLEGIEQSLKFFEKAISLSPTSTIHLDYARALAQLGEALHSQGWIEQSLHHFETALNIQQNALYLHPDWLFSYACTLDMYGDFHDEEKFYRRATELLSHILMIDPDFPNVHHKIAQTLCHLGELTGDSDNFYRAIHHLRLAKKRDADNDQITLDWGIALVNIAQHGPLRTDVEQLFHDAEQKMTQAAKLGNLQAYYHLSCLYSLRKDTERAMIFLHKAEAFCALPSIDELLSDDWLENLRSTSEFIEFLEQSRSLNEER